MSPKLLTCRYRLFPSRFKEIYVLSSKLFMHKKEFNRLGLFVLAIILTFYLSNGFSKAQVAITFPGQTQREGSFQWLDIRQLGVEGRGWNDTKDFYDRL